MITFVNGCFDVLHVGHVRLLRFAAGLCPDGRLVVGLNSDASVRRLKGDGRPINPFSERAEMLLSLACVDEVMPFDEDDPATLIQQMIENGGGPSMVVKGSEYRDRIYPELRIIRSAGIRVVYFEKTHHSTTAIVEQSCHFCSGPCRCERSGA